MLKTIFEALLAPAAQEQGQALIMGVGVVVLGLGAIMISLDIGWWVRDKGDLQNDADSIALAAAGELPNESAALDSGEDAATANGVDPSTVEYTFEDRNGDTNSDLVRVRLVRQSNSFLASSFGVPDPELTVRAVAGDLTASGACLRPWAIRADNDDPSDFYGLDSTALYVLQNRLADENDDPGDVGAISWYGWDTDSYSSSIEFDCTDEVNFKVKPTACSAGKQKLVSESDILLDCHWPEQRAKHAIKALKGRHDDPSACDVDEYAKAVENARRASCADRAVPVAIVNTLRPDDKSGPGGEPKVTVHGLATFYIAGWAADNDDCNDAGGQALKDCVWGYLLPHAPALPQWVVGWSAPGSLSANPFTPVSIALVE